LISTQKIIIISHGSSHFRQSWDSFLGVDLYAD